MDARVRRHQSADLARALSLRHRLVEYLPDRNRTPAIPPLKDLPAQPGGGVLFRFNRDSRPRRLQRPRRVPLLLCAGGRPSDRPHCADAHEARRSIPSPRCWPATVTTRSGDDVTVLLTLENTGTFDAYGIDAVMISPDDTTTIGNNTVGGNGRVRPGGHVAVGSIVKHPTLSNWGASTAKPYAGRQYSGDTDRTYTFTRADAGRCRPGHDCTELERRPGRQRHARSGQQTITHRCRWTWTRASRSASTRGTIAAGAVFTRGRADAARHLPYTINSEPYTPPVIVVSYSDPQGSHRFVTPVELARDGRRTDALQRPDAVWLGRTDHLDGALQ